MERGPVATLARGLKAQPAPRKILIGLEVSLHRHCASREDRKSRNDPNASLHFASYYLFSASG
jgi:hypothetical protein